MQLDGERATVLKRVAQGHRDERARRRAWPPARAGVGRWRRSGVGWLPPSSGRRAPGGPISEYPRRAEREPGRGGQKTGFPRPGARAREEKGPRATCARVTATPGTRDTGRRAGNHVRGAGGADPGEGSDPEARRFSSPPPRVTGPQPPPRGARRPSLHSRLPPARPHSPGRPGPRPGASSGPRPPLPPPGASPELQPRSQRPEETARRAAGRAQEIPPASGARRRRRRGRAGGGPRGPDVGSRRRRSPPRGRRGPQRPGPGDRGRRPLPVWPFSAPARGLPGSSHAAHYSPLGLCQTTHQPGTPAGLPSGERGTAGKGEQRARGAPRGSPSFPVGWPG